MAYVFSTNLILGIILTSLGIIIFILGFLGYKRSLDITPLLIGLIFGIFSVSGILVILNILKNSSSSYFIIRLIGYLIALIAIYRYLKKETLFVKER